MQKCCPITNAKQSSPALSGGVVPLNHQPERGCFPGGGLSGAFTAVPADIRVDAVDHLPPAPVPHDGSDLDQFAHGTGNIAGKYTDIRRKLFPCRQDFAGTTITSDSTNAFKTAGSGTIVFTSTTNGTERLRTGDSKYAWTKIEFTNVSGVTVSPVIDRIRVHLDKTAAIDVTAPYRDGTWPVETQFVFNEERNHVYLVVNHPGPPTGMTATITSADSPYGTLAFEYYASDATWKPLTTTSDPSSALSVIGTHAIRWVRPDDWTSMTLTVDDIDNGATATLAITGYLMRIIRATAPTTDLYYSLGIMNFASRAFGQTTIGGMPLAEAQTVSYVTYQIGNNTATSDLTFAVANATTGEMGSFTVAAGRTSSMDETAFKADLSSPVSFTAGQGLMLLQIGGSNISDVHFQLYGT